MCPLLTHAFAVFGKLNWVADLASAISLHGHYLLHCLVGCILWGCTLHCPYCNIDEHTHSKQLISFSFSFTFAGAAPPPPSEPSAT